MEKEKRAKIFIAVNNISAVALTLISLFYMAPQVSPAKVIDIIIWSIVAGLTHRMTFNLKVINFCIGTIFATSMIFIFEWYYIPFAYIITQLIYRFSCLVVRDNSETGTRAIEREFFIVSNIVLTGVVSALIKTYFLPSGNIDLSKDILPLLMACLIESFIGLIFIYVDYKYKNIISSVVLSIAGHLKETWLIYLVYFGMVINISVLFQNYGYIGLIVSSSYIFALRLAFDRQAKVNKLEVENTTDVLTGVKNKKYYLDILPEEFTNSCAIFFIDFNGFKLINDKYGHDIGDDVIIHGARILESAVRDRDDVIRFGGDEFMLLINDADRDICKEITNRIDSLCEEMVFKNKNIEIKLSMSVGISICPEDSRVKDELVTLADERMYKVKHGKEA